MSYKTNRKTGGIFRVNNLLSLLNRHIYSYRDYNVGEFADAYHSTDNSENQTEIRMKYRSMESGRIYRSMDELHKFVAALDVDERELFRERNPELMRMINEFAVVEDLGQF